MNKRRWGLALAAIGILAICIPSAGYGERSDPADRTTPLEARLISFAEELRLGVSLAAFAAYSPTILDLRLHAQQLINLIEGVEGEDYARPSEPPEDRPGLLVEATAWLEEIGDRPIPAEAKERLITAGKNVLTFLNLARDAALAIRDERRIAVAKERMLEIYAYLAAAYEPPCGHGYLPGLWTILKGFGIAEEAEGQPHS